MCETSEKITISQDTFHQKQPEGYIVGRAKGLVGGLIEGRSLEVADLLLKIVQLRFPELEALARQFVQYTPELCPLEEVFMGVSLAQTEEQARPWLLHHPQA